MDRESAVGMCKQITNEYQYQYIPRQPLSKLLNYKYKIVIAQKFSYKYKNTIYHD